MQSDLPHMMYKYEKKKDPKKQTVASDEVIRLQEEANRRMEERKAAKMKGETPYELEDLFKK